MYVEGNVACFSIVADTTNLHQLVSSNRIKRALIEGQLHCYHNQ